MTTPPAESIKAIRHSVVYTHAELEAAGYTITRHHVGGIGYVPFAETGDESVALVHGADGYRVRR